MTFSQLISGTGLVIYYTRKPTLMKTNSTLSPLSFMLIVSLTLTHSLTSSAQNIMGNSNFNNGNNYWNMDGMSTEVGFETGYGGSNSLNKVAEVDGYSGLRQKIEVRTGQTYKLTYKAGRSLARFAPLSPSIQIRVIGGQSKTSYLDFTKTYSNSVYSLKSESAAFSIAGNSGDEAVIIEITGYNNSTSMGVVLDDVELTSIAAMTMPVKWVSFSAELRNGQASLQWKTAAELNNKYFVVERAGANNQFDSIGTVNPQSSGVYSFADSKVKEGINYYRIRQVDVDGQYQYSKVLSVKFGQLLSGMKVYPTVANNNINVNLTSTLSTQALLTVVDLNGAVVSKSVRNLGSGMNQQSVDVSGLKSGMYYVRIQNSDQTVLYTQAFHKVN